MGQETFDQADNSGTAWLNDLKFGTNVEIIWKQTLNNQHLFNLMALQGSKLHLRFCFEKSLYFAYLF